MAYSAGSTILDDHYNEFTTGSSSGSATHGTRNINTVWGSGSGNKGYGQGSTLSAVSAGSSVTATQWETLLSKLETTAAHQGTTLTTGGGAYSTINAGDSIAALSTLDTDITNIYSNRSNAAASGSDITASSNNTTTWNTQTTFTATTDFANDDSATKFFNAGGMIGINFTNQGGGSGSKDTAWGNIISAVGTIWLTSAGPSGSATNVTVAGTSYTGTDKKGGSGSTTTLSNIGYHDLSTAYNETFKQYDSTYVYTANYITVRWKYTSSNVYAEVKLFDNANTSGNPGATQDETINLNIQCNLTVRQPSTTYLSNSWGTPSASVTYSDS
jgi:hypothetical protein